MTYENFKTYADSELATLIESIKNRGIENAISDEVKNTIQNLDSSDIPGMINKINALLIEDHKAVLVILGKRKISKNRKKSTISTFNGARTYFRFSEMVKYTVERPNGAVLTGSIRRGSRDPKLESTYKSRVSSLQSIMRKLIYKKARTLVYTEKDIYDLVEKYTSEYNGAFGTSFAAHHSKPYKRVTTSTVTTTK